MFGNTKRSKQLWSDLLGFFLFIPVLPLDSLTSVAPGEILLIWCALLRRLILMWIDGMECNSIMNHIIFLFSSRMKYAYYVHK